MPQSVLATLEAQAALTDYRVNLQSKEASAEFSTCYRNGRLQFSTPYRTTTQTVDLQSKYTITPEAKSIYSVLSAASRFHYHLRRAPQPSHRLKDRFRVEFHELHQTGPSYIRRGENMIGLGSVAHVNVDDKTAYGMTITSDCMEPLHVWAFYFDCSDLSISMWI